MNETMKKVGNVVTQPLVVTGAAVTGVGTAALYVPVLVTGGAGMGGTAATGGAIMVAPFIAKGFIIGGVSMMLLGFARSFLDGFKQGVREATLADELKGTIKEVAEGLVGRATPSRTHTP